jgi:7-cyano-7-deazaguanine synthase
METKVVLLFSGGIDSTALLRYYLDLNYNVSTIFIDYNQPSRISEYKAARKLAKYFNIPLKKLKLSFSLRIHNYEYATRNLLLLTIATSTVELDHYIVAIGIHSGSKYYDCSKDFVDNSQKILDGYFQGRVIVDAPFLDYSKKEIIKYCQKKKIPIELTYSCETKNGLPCGKCPSCLDRRFLLNED